ncbi:NUDIX domain-containing protein [Whalleya microplaca]|nr:NUDIX domain-containing protein [Whalleya microplaca]
MASGSSSNRTMESRTGRNNQRYNSKGERLVAGVVPLTEDRGHVLLIQSTRRKGWVLPKGGWELDEECTEAAEREAWEEAGITIQIDYDLGEVIDSRPPKRLSKDAPKALYRFYEATVLTEEEDWPERHKRERRWFTFSQAKEVLSDRPELLKALELSTMPR